MQASDAEVGVLVILLTFFMLICCLLAGDSKFVRLFFSNSCLTKCPLCMEQLEIDDVNFYPCTCGYQVMKYLNYYFCSKVMYTKSKLSYSNLQAMQ